VLIDAPCTGTGVIRRHPEVRYRLSEADPARLAAVQERILERCAGLVRPGGVLVYAVCSLEPEEGPDQAARFLGRHPGFRVEDPEVALPSRAGRFVARAPFGPHLATFPHHDGIDGFFAVRLRRHL
jgi:16S rRNA (cytosine967-C5)-methyltransferase